MTDRDQGAEYARRIEDARDAASCADANGWSRFAPHSRMAQETYLQRSLAADGSASALLLDRIIASGSQEPQPDEKRVSEERHCKTCGNSLNRLWAACPMCGADAREDVVASRKEPEVAAGENDQPQAVAPVDQHRSAGGMGDVTPRPLRRDGGTQNPDARGETMPAPAAAPALQPLDRDQVLVPEHIRKLAASESCRLTHAETNAVLAFVHGLSKRAPSVALPPSDRVSLRRETVEALAEAMRALAERHPVFTTEFRDAEKLLRTDASPAQEDG